MIPQGPIWQQMRQSALSVVPNGTRINHKVPQTIKNWLKRGTFTVNSLSGSKYSLTAAADEIGCALFAEAAFQLDHAAEHSVTVRYQLSSGKWYSSAWLCVTFYYWAFYLALSITRMLGATSCYLAKEEAAALYELASAGTGKVGAGPYILACDPTINGAQRTVTFSKSSNSRIHDLAWRVLFAEFDRLEKFADSTANSDEARLFKAIVGSMKNLGAQWPSDLRNSVNYSPGFGYGDVRKNTTVQGFSLVKFDPPATFEDVLDRFERSCAEFPSKSVIANPAAATKLLINATFILDSIAHLLHAEVIERRKLDVRWSTARSKFLADRFADYTNSAWPCFVE